LDSLLQKTLGELFAVVERHLTFYAPISLSIPLIAAFLMTTANYAAKVHFFSMQNTIRYKLKFMSWFELRDKAVKSGILVKK
jgi:hypothetical protein